MPATPGTEEVDPLQQISAYFLSPEFQRGAHDVQKRYPDLLSFKRARGGDKPDKRTTARMEKEGIDLEVDAAVDEALKAVVASEKGHASDPDSYEYPLKGLVDVAFSHIKPRRTMLWASDSLASGAYAHLRPRLADARDTLAKVTDEKRDNTSITFLNGVIERIDQFVAQAPPHVPEPEHPNSKKARTRKGGKAGGGGSSSDSTGPLGRAG
jgi:hypothetical protein